MFRLFVNEDFRGNSYGQGLLDSFAAHAWRKGVRKIRLEAGSNEEMEQQRKRFLERQEDRAKDLGKHYARLIAEPISPIGLVGARYEITHTPLGRHNLF